MLTHERATALRAELHELHTKSGYTLDDLSRIDEIGDAIASAISDRSRKATVDDLGAPPDLGGGGFADAIRSAGFTGPRGTTSSRSSSRPPRSTATRSTSPRDGSAAHRSPTTSGGCTRCSRWST